MGRFMFIERDNHRIRYIKDGEVFNFAGAGPEGYIDGDGAVAEFNSPRSIAFDKEGNLFVADTDNHVIRKITIE